MEKNTENKLKPPPSGNRGQKVRGIMKLMLLEQKGDVKFYENEKGILFQQLQGGDGDIFKCKDGKIVYRPIKQVNNYAIKYNTNGCYGYTIFRSKTALEDRIWTLQDAERIANEMQ